jgi:hypothetical protein
MTGSVGEGCGKLQSSCRPTCVTLRLNIVWNVFDCILLQTLVGIPKTVVRRVVDDGQEMVQRVADLGRVIKDVWLRVHRRMDWKISS